MDRWLDTVDGGRQADDVVDDVTDAIDRHDDKDVDSHVVPVDWQYECDVIDDMGRRRDTDDGGQSAVGMPLDEESGTVEGCQAYSIIGIWN